MSFTQTPLQHAFSYLRDTFSFFSTHIIALVLLVLPYVLMNTAIGYAYLSQLEQSQLLYAGLALELALHPILQSVLILYMAAAITDKPRSIKECYLYSVQFWPRILLLTLISTLAMIIGFSLFILPGLYVLVRLSLSEMYCILDNQNVFTGLRESFTQTVPMTWVITLGLLLLMPVITGINIGLSSLNHEANNPLIDLPITTVQTLLQMLYTIYLFRIFTAVRSKTGE